MMTKVIDRHLCAKSATKMLAVILIASFLASGYCIPAELASELNPPIKIEEPISEESKLLEKVPEEIEQPAPVGIVPIPEGGGASLPEDLGLAPDANPAAQPDNSDLDTDATFWGWGYRRPYYGYRSYYSSPWRRWGGYGYGRGYGGGWGWGRGWGWRGNYW